MRFGAVHDGYRGAVAVVVAVLVAWPATAIVAVALFHRVHAGHWRPDAEVAARDQALHELVTRNSTRSRAAARRPAAETACTRRRRRRHLVRAA
jgi:hypothetical protein